MKSLLPALCASTALLATAAAHADATFSAVTLSSIGTSVLYDGVPNSGIGFTGFPLSLTFTSAGIASGEVSGFEEAGYAPGQASVSGLNGFVSLVTYMDSATVGTLAGSLSLDVTFSPAGQITSDYIQFAGNDITFTIVNGQAQLGSDGPLNCLATEDSGACTSAVAFVQVPEPGTFSLVLGGLSLITAMRRRLG